MMGGHERAVDAIFSPASGDWGRARHAENIFRYGKM
jgi:hypothetical protein